MEDPLVLARAGPPGLWLTANVLTVLAVMGNPLSGLAQALAKALGGVISVAAQGTVVCLGSCGASAPFVVLAFAALILVLASKE